MKAFFEKVIIYVRPFLNWRFLVTYGLVWSWHIFLYAGIAIGIIFKIKQLYTICITVYGILWLPWCSENLFQIPLAIWLHTKLFKNDVKTRQQLDKMYDEAKADWAKIKSKFKKKRL